MKKVSNIVLGIFVLFISCKSDPSAKILSDATGSLNHLLIVEDSKDWLGDVGDEIRRIIAEPVLGLPQHEAQFGITQIPERAFNYMFKTNRSILIVRKAEQELYHIETDRYSSPQKVITIQAPTNEKIITILNQNKSEIIETFKVADIKSLQTRLQKKVYKPKTFKTLDTLGVHLEIPRDYLLVDDTGDFLWLRKHIDKGSLNLLAYSLPMPLETMDLIGEVIKNRDYIGKKFIPGQLDGTYMVTEKAYTPHHFSTTLDGKYAIETLGKWEVKGDYLAGPFINYTIKDMAKNRLIVVEGFTVAPEAEKRDYMFELEAILKTFKEYSPI